MLCPGHVIKECGLSIAQHTLLYWCLVACKCCTTLIITLARIRKNSFVVIVSLYGGNRSKWLIDPLTVASRNMLIDAPAVRRCQP